jgi:OCT family organic cation transporter-like MFS transporter 4/5
MEVDEAIGKLGSWGKWQVTYYTMLCVAVTFTSCWHMLAIVFIGGKPEHHCKIPVNSTINETIPLEKGVYSQCSMYVRSGSNETKPCTEWHYYGDIGDTIVSKWDLVCDRYYLKDMSQTILIVGVMIGAMGFTSLSDMFGRKPIFLFSQWALVIVGVANAFVTNYYVFLVLRFFTGALQQGVILPGFVMACELFAARHRTFAGIIIEDFWGVATCLLAVFAYFIRNWVYLQLLISLLGLLTIPLFWFLPESVPWLCANNRIEEAETIIRNAAKMNGVTMPERILKPTGAPDKLDDEAKSSGQDGDAADKDGTDGKNGGKFLVKFSKFKKFKLNTEKGGKEAGARYTLLDVFRNRRLTIYCICMSFLWMVITLVYYGLSLSAGELAGNRYVNNFLSGLVEIPAYTASFFILQKFGRRRPLIVFHIVAGVALLLSQVVPETTAGGISLIPLRMTFSMIGKFGITGAFGIVFLYAPEIFPTTIRSQAMGIASLTGRIGNMIAPFTTTVVQIVPWLPGLVFGGLSIGGGLLTLVLPETLNRPLPQTIEDIEEWARKDSKRKSSPTADGQQELKPVGNDTDAANKAAV